MPVNYENGNIYTDSSAKRRDIRESNEIINEEVNTTERNEYLKGMIDKKLLQKFRSINPQNLQIKFSMKPIEAKLQHIFVVPITGLTRQIVEEKAYLKGAIYRLHSAYRENGFDSNYFDMVTDFAKDIGPDFNSKRTVVAEATIRCLEFFQVKNSKSGIVVQGMEDGCEEEEVLHIVRFEVVTDKSEDSDKRKIGNWKIIDLDDLLGGNLFH